MPETSETPQDELLKAKLNLETGLVSWAELQVFFARGQLLVVDRSLDLIETASTLADDNKAYIERLMKQDLLLKPDIEWVKSHCSESTEFWTLVVAPFVMIQPKTE